MKNKSPCSLAATPYTTPKSTLMVAHTSPPPCLNTGRALTPRGLRCVRRAFNQSCVYERMCERKGVFAQACLRLPRSLPRKGPSFPRSNTDVSWCTKLARSIGGQLALEGTTRKSKPLFSPGPSQGPLLAAPFRNCL